MRVLLTGARGFIGRACVRELLGHGVEIHAATSAGAGGAGPVAWHHADLRDPTQARQLVRTVRPTHLIHLAWNTAHGVYWTAPDNLDWVLGGLELLRAFGEQGGERAVGVGTCAEYDWQNGTCTEDVTPIVPVTPYGKAKHALDAIGALSSSLLGFQWCWARPFFPYGPEDKPARLIPATILALLDGREAPCTAGDQIRDFIHVDDAGKALVHLLMGSYQGAVNVASGTPVTIATVVRTLGRLTGREDLLRLGALPVRPGDPPKVVADVRRLRSLGVGPGRSLEEGLHQTVRWWEERLAAARKAR